MPPDPGEQERVQVGLVEHVGLREAVHPGPQVAAELGHHPVAGIEQTQPTARPRPSQEALADADLMQGPGHLVVQVPCSRQRVRPQVALQQGGGEPGVRQQQGGSGADRTRAHHDDRLDGPTGLLVLHGMRTIASTAWAFHAAPRTDSTASCS